MSGTGRAGLIVIGLMLIVVSAALYASNSPVVGTLFLGFGVLCLAMSSAPTRYSDDDDRNDWSDRG